MKAPIRLVAIGFCACLFVALPGCGNKYHDKVIGTWDTDMPFQPRITLSKDGTGSMSVNVGGQSVSKAIKWRLNGSNLILTVEGKDLGGVIKSAEDQKIVLNDPDAMQDVIFTRVKQ